MNTTSYERTVQDESRQAVADALAEILQRVSAGERIDLAELAAERPEVAEQLEQLLPTALMLADLGYSQGMASPAAPLASEPGRKQATGVLGDFRILREIGRGGMGVVYEAEQISLARRVALKILPFAAVLDPRQLQRFKNEALAAAHLDHPNIVEVYGIGCERSVHYYAMRFVEGVTLADVIAELAGQKLGQSKPAATPSTLERTSGWICENQGGTAGLPSSERAAAASEHSSPLLSTSPAPLLSCSNLCPGCHCWLVQQCERR